MSKDRQRDFRQFVGQRSAELFPIALALAGRQDAAEKLLQAALEKTWCGGWSARAATRSTAG